MLSGPSIVGTPLQGKGGLSLRSFAKKGGGLDFSHKKGVGKICGFVLKKVGTLSLIFILTNHFQSYLSLNEWW